MILIKDEIEVCSTKTECEVSDNASETDVGKLYTQLKNKKDTTKKKLLSKNKL